MEYLTTATLFLTTFHLVTTQSTTTAVVYIPTSNHTTVSLASASTANYTSIPSVHTSLKTATQSSISESPSSTVVSPTLQPLTAPVTTSLPPVVTHNSAVRNYDWVVALVVLTSIGILSVVGLELYIHIKICCTPLVRQGATLWLGHVLLFAILLSYVLLYAFVPYPSPTTCAIIRFCLGVCYALCFAVLLVKLILILSPDVVPTGVSAVLLLFVWLVQIVLDIWWLIRNPPEVTRVDNADGCACAHGFHEHIKSLIYVMVLIVLTFCACVVARYNGSDVADDAIQIGVSTGVTIAVWIVWILLGYLKNDSEYHDPCLAFGLLVTVTTLLLGVFVPKLRRLNQLKEVDWELPVEEPKSTADTKGDPAMSVATSGSRRNLGSVEIVGWNGEIPYKSGNGTARNRAFDVQYGGAGAVPAFPPNLDPFALHLQYPSSPEPYLKRSGSIHSAPSGYEQTRTFSAIPSTLRASTRSNSQLKHNGTVEIQVVSRNQRVNQNHVSYVINHNPNPTVRPKVLVRN